MNRHLLWSALSIAVLMACSSIHSQPRDDSPSRYGITPAAIERVEVLYYPERILTRTALTPEMLERQYMYKVEIREFPASLQREQLVPALQAASFSRSADRSHDLRTAVLLFDKSNKRILSLYFDSSGR